MQARHVAHAGPIDVHTSTEWGKHSFSDQWAALHHQRLKQRATLGEGAAEEEGKRSGG